MDALAEIQYEIGCRIRVHLETRWQRGQKMKGLCKEDKVEGRWETVEDFCGYLRSPQTGKCILCYGQNNTPTCMRSLSLFHTYLDTYTQGRMLIPGPMTPALSPCHHTFSLCLHLSVSLWLKWNQAWNTERLLKHTAVCYTKTTLCCRCLQWRAAWPINCTGPHHLTHCCFPFGNDFI